MALNHSSTAAVFFHWFSVVLRLMLVLMLSSIFFLLTMPSSLSAGLIRQACWVEGEVAFMVFKGDEGLLRCDAFGPVVYLKISCY